MKKILSISLTALLVCSALSTTACEKGGDNTPTGDNVLRVASWDEYIDMGGSVYQEDDPDTLAFKEWYFEQTGIDLANSRPLYEEFEDWYFEQTGKKIKVEYVALQDNETMYNKIKMGDSYDLLCPSEYMAMKLKSEDALLAYPESFFDTAKETNYYAKNVSAYTNDIFVKTGLTQHIAGYMWGTTGFVFNPEKINRDIMKSWHCLISKECSRKITAKDNTRDSYFMGLGMYYEDYLLGLNPDSDTYADDLSAKMNDTSKETMSEVKKLLENARKNLYGLETDEAKNDLVSGRLDASYQWSGDAVYILDEAESETELALEYSIPEAVSNLWFDGWVMMKDANVDAATAFVNFLSMPRNAIRNMYYIGYTSCLAGAELYEYLDYTYGAEEDDTTAVDYDLSYFFGDTFEPLSVPQEQLRRQLFAQYPDDATRKRLVVMDYFDKEENERANRMWNNIK